MCLLLTQGWPQAGMTMAPDHGAKVPCAEHMSGGEKCPCCPDGAMASGCAAMCTSSVAVTATAIKFMIPTDQTPERLVVLIHDGPNYLPLNPPPIA